MESGSDINLRANSYSDATMKFNDSNGDYTNVFSVEGEVQIYIGNPATTGVKMMHGYVVSINTERTPKRERIITLYIVDWGSYLAAKRNFEKRYFSGQTAEDVFNDTLSSVTDGVDTLTGTNIATIGGTIKQFFEGTSVKDVWNTVAENCGCDYFCDETLDLNTFTIGSKYLQTGGSTYKLLDTTASGSNQITIRHDFPYEFTFDVSQRVRNVTVTNGLMQTFPDISDINSFQTETFHNDVFGKDFLKHMQMSVKLAYDVNLVGTSLNPVTLTAKELIGTQTLPSAKLNVETISFSNADVLILSDNASGTQSLGLTINDWEELGFYIKHNLTGLTRMDLYLIDSGSKYWKINIYPYISTSWKYIRLGLPNTSSNSEVYTGGSWTKTGSPTTLNYIQFVMTPTTFSSGNSISFAQFNLYTLRKKTATASGNPPTQKIIVDGSQTHPDQLQSFATAEQTRLNKIATNAKCTFTGNTDFKKPGYLIDVDFSNTLGTARSGTGTSGLRLDSIRHFLQSGFHFTTVDLSNSFNRP